MKKSTFSVIIPLYNHEKYIGETIRSVIEQTFSDFELIIINDGSTDGSEEVVRAISDKRIRYFYQENQGAHNAINRGVQISEGEYVAVLNSDDVYHPSRLKNSICVFEKNCSVCAVFSQLECLDTEGKLLHTITGIEDYLSMINPDANYRSEGNMIFDLLAGNFLSTTSNLICRKKVFDEIGLFRNLKYAHDYDFFLRLCYHFKTQIIEAPLLKYRIHPENTIKTSEAEVGFEIGMVLSHFLMNYNLKKLFSEQEIHDVMLKFVNSIRANNSENMILTLILFGLKYNLGSDIINIQSKISQWELFKKTCIDRIREENNKLNKLQEGCDWWSHRAENIKEELIKTKEKLFEITIRLDETKKELDMKTQHLRNVSGSKSYRFKRAMSWMAHNKFFNK